MEHIRKKSEGVYEVTDHGLADWQAMFDSSDWARRYRDTVRAHAERTGRVTLQYWRLHMGPFFGEASVMNTAQVAKQLDVPVSDLQEIRRETMALVRQRVGKPPL
jgi:hypothetical protein